MRVEKPWGHEDRWCITNNYVSKILFIKAGHSLSLQHHEHKEETIRILSGVMILKIGRTIEEALKTEIRMEPDDIYHIVPGLIHRMVAVEDVRVLEVSTTELDDVVRHQDEYGRA